MSATANMRSPDEASQLTFGLDVDRPVAVRQALIKGLPFSSLLTFERVSALARQEVADLIGVSETTLLRRQREKKLESAESDRLFRIAQIYKDLLALFHGDADDANSWLRSPHVVFGGETPLDMLKSDFGARQVETLIRQIEHGVYV